MSPRQNPPTASGPLLEVAGLSVDIPLAAGILHPVRGVDLTVDRGEVLGIVGESGSGKSMTALALVNLLPQRALRSANTLRLGSRDLLSMADRELSETVRGDRITMIFQEPMTSLNPVYTIGRQLTETALLHRPMSRAEAGERAVHLLEKAGITAPGSRLRQYPHQLSGGQRQRVMIAMALMNEPELIIADEPTTALDVTIQAQILRLLVELQRELGMAMILITHDLGIIARTANRIAVMYGGEIVETGAAADILESPRHPYTRGLLECIPDPGTETRRLGAIPGIVPSLIGDIPGCAFANRCPLARHRCLSAPPPVHRLGPGRSYRCVETDPRPEARVSRRPDAASAERGRRPAADHPIASVRGAVCEFRIRSNVFSRTRVLRAVDRVDLDLQDGEVLALVGESGCGKTTLARILLGLQPVQEGVVRLDGLPIADLAAPDRARRIQPVFQDPYSSLNPRRTIGQIIGRPLEIHRLDTSASRRAEVARIMDLVGLPSRLYYSYPSQISGGQRQRVAIARAIIMKPGILVCDEPTSALDVSVQSQILNLLLDLRAELGLTYLLITHDLAVVEYLATRVAVMYLGQIVETGTRERIFSRPKHPYTRALMQSVLTLQPGAPIPDNRIGHSYPDPLDVPPGCRFNPRCPERFDRCLSMDPELVRDGEGRVRCLLFGETRHAETTR